MTHEEALKIVDDVETEQSAGQARTASIFTGIFDQALMATIIRLLVTAGRPFIKLLAGTLNRLLDKIDNEHGGDTAPDPE